MSLEGTLFVTGLSLVGGWMLKVLSDRISTWQTEKKLINSIIYHLYDLGRYADRVLSNYSMFFHLTKGERDEDIYHFLLSLNKGVDVKEVLNKIHGNLLSLAEIDPVHAMELNAFISSMEMAFEMTRLDFSDDEGSKLIKKTPTVLKEIRSKLTDRVEQLLAMRNFFRKKRDKKSFIEAGLIDESVEEMLKNIRE